MRVLVACELPGSAITDLKSLGGDVIYDPGLSAESLPARLADITALVIGRTHVSADAIAAGTALQIIVRAGTDVSTIAVEEASAQGIFVTHTPNRDAVAVAEMYLTLMTALDRNLVDAVSSARGAAAKGAVPQPDARGLAGRSLGLLGLGPVGRELAARARALRMDVSCWSPELSPERAREHEMTFCTWSRDLGRRCDLICVDPSGAHADEVLVTDEFLQSLLDGTQLIHIGSMASIDENALVEAVRSGRVRLAIDLAASESARDSRPKSRLADLPGVILTHRLAGKTRQARESIATEVVQILREFWVAGTVRNCVNLMERSPATWLLVLRLRDAVGVMASIMDAIRSDGINAEEITTRVFLGARAAWCTIALDERPSADALDTIRKIQGVLHLELRAVV